jgi:hypothetical protein
MSGSSIGFIVVIGIVFMLGCLIFVGFLLYLLLNMGGGGGGKKDKDYNGDDPPATTDAANVVIVANSYQHVRKGNVLIFSSPRINLDPTYFDISYNPNYYGKSKGFNGYVTYTGGQNGDIIADEIDIYVTVVVNNNYSTAFLIWKKEPDGGTHGIGGGSGKGSSSYNTPEYNIKPGTTYWVTDDAGNTVIKGTKWNMQAKVTIPGEDSDEDTGEDTDEDQDE